MDLEFPDDAEYDTLGGMIIDMLGHIPGEREHPRVQVEDVVFSVLKVTDRRIAKVQAERIATPEPPPVKEKERSRDRETKE